MLIYMLSPATFSPYFFFFHNIHSLISAYKIDNMDAPLNLTFGVEFEFIVRYNPAKYEPYMSSADGILWYGHGEEQSLYREEKLGMMVRAHIIAAFHKNGIPVNRYGRNGEPEKGYQKWGVTRDGSIYPGDECEDPRFPNLRCTGVELQSPAYHLTDHSINQVEQVLKLLTNNFDVFVNSSCGLHVHVGNGHRGLPVRTLKNFCFLTAAFERQLNSLHPLHRIQNEYARPFSRLHPKQSTWGKLLAIDGLNTVLELVDLFNTCDGVKDAHVAYNLANLVWTSKKTIEFRQHAATLDPTAVIRWVETVTGLVSRSNTTAYPAYAELLQYIDDSRFSGVDFLQALGLHRAAEYYRARGIWDHDPQSWDWVDPVLQRQRLMRNQMTSYEKELADERAAAANVPVPVSARARVPAILTTINNNIHNSRVKLDEEILSAFSFSDEKNFLAIRRNLQQPLHIKGGGDPSSSSSQTAAKRPFFPAQGNKPFQTDTGEPFPSDPRPLPTDATPSSVIRANDDDDDDDESHAPPPIDEEAFLARQSKWLSSFFN